MDHQRNIGKSSICAHWYSRAQKMNSTYVVLMISTNHISHIVAHRLEPPMLQTHGASTPTTRVWQFHTLTHMIESRGWNYCFSYYHTETNDCPPIFRAPLRIHISTLFAITLWTSRGSKRLFVLQLWRHSDSTCTITRLFFSSTPTGQECTIDTFKMGTISKRV